MRMTSLHFNMTPWWRHLIGFDCGRIARCVFAGKNDHLGKGVTPVASPGRFKVWGE